MAIVRQWLLLLLVVLSWSSGLAATIVKDGSSDTAPDGSTEVVHLTLTESSPRRIAGHYSSSDGGGIRFDMDTSNDCSSLSISTQQGGRVLATKQYKLEGETPLGISLFDHYFLVSYDKSTLGRTEYLVPPRYFEPALKSVVLFKYLRKHLDEEGANETRSTAIGQLLASKEAMLMVQAARALGERGVRGQGNPAAMMFYVVAMHVQNLLAGRTGDGRRGGMANSWEPSTGEQRTHTSHWIGTTQGEEFCNNTNGWCPTGRCPEGDECTGLCGTTCSCWKFVCGNCCVNKMCLDHDIYCTKDGELSWCCLGIFIDAILGKISCDKPYTC